MPIEVKARPTDDICGWCQQRHATVFFRSKKNLRSDLKMAPSLQLPLNGQGVRRIPGMTQAPRSQQSLNGQGENKIPWRLR